MLENMFSSLFSLLLCNKVQHKKHFKQNTDYLFMALFLLILKYLIQIKKNQYTNTNFKFLNTLK